MKKADPPLSVQIPTAGADQPSWLRVGVIAVLGFAVGIAWPRLAGVKLGPNAPSAVADTPSAVAPAAGTAKPGAPSHAAEAPTASLVAPAATAPAPGAAAGAAEGTPAPVASSGTGPTTLTVKPGILLSCRTEAGETLKGKACGSIPFDAIALPRLKRLSQCPAAAGNDGKLSPVFHLDFNNNKLTIQMGTKNTVGNVDSFSACLGGLFEKVSINAVTHEHVKYSILYNLTFAPGEAGKGSSAAAQAGAAGAGANAGAIAGDTGGDAKIAWPVAVVRDAPRTGSIVGRLPRGTSVQVTATENNWYKVKSGTTEGWLYRGAIGR